MKLYPYQRVGSAFMAVAGSSLNADDCGLGKTAQTIRAIQLQQVQGHQVLPLLIICPNAVKRSWGRQLGRWWPGLRVVVALSGTARAAKAALEVREGRADALVLNLEALPNLSRLAPYGSVRIERCRNCDPTSTREPRRCQWHAKPLNEIEWRTVVADEAHRAKDPKAQWTRALWALGDRATFRHALTGTPIANDADDLWSVMRFVAPDEYPVKTKWCERYTLMLPNLHSGFLEPGGFRPETREEFDRFFLPRFIRRPKAAVLPDLPPRTYVRRDVRLAGRQEQAYRDFRDSLVARVDNGTLFAANPLQEVLRLKQLASAYMQAVVREDGSVGYRLTEEESYTKKDGTAGTRRVPAAKLDALEELLEDLGPDRQAVVFAEHAQLLKLLAARWDADKTPYARLVGGMSDAARREEQERFERGDARYLMATFGAGGEGVDGLQVADVVVFLQRSWSRVQNEQAEARVHRVGQQAANVTVVDLVTVDSVEERVLASLKEKGDRFEALVRDEATIRAWLV